ncbi:hypothetical protein QVD17_00267 [Tagetes erecta]|uniref:Uncharacterized protein n=1 Tax=Tagetes erecta TaxID=13708 RepID=A0AAD8P725_TARER|nr:hypothetical protein QVD17_00267 [Tagetes erecta]
MTIRKRRGLKPSMRYKSEIKTVNTLKYEKVETRRGGTGEAGDVFDMNKALFFNYAKFTGVAFLLTRYMLTIGKRVV